MKAILNQFTISHWLMLSIVYIYLLVFYKTNSITQKNDTQKHLF